jgi:hypothetical protein
VRYEERVGRLDRAVAEGRVIRGEWEAVESQACLLTWLSPEAGAARSERACPAEVMPLWLAYLTTSLNDRTSLGGWELMVPRYAALARRWYKLDAAAWDRALSACHASFVREADLLFDPVKARSFAEAPFPGTPWAIEEMASDLAKYRRDVWDSIAFHVLDAVEAECLKVEKGGEV